MSFERTTALPSLAASVVASHAVTRDVITNDTVTPDTVTPDTVTPDTVTPDTVCTNAATNAAQGNDGHKSAPPTHRDRPNHGEASGELLGALLPSQPRPAHAAALAGLAPIGGGAVVGWCEIAEHPVLEGRTLVRFSSAAGESSTSWVPTLMGLRVEAGDRVLLQACVGLAELVVTGVIDGYRPRLRHAHPGPILCLREGEPLTVVDVRGRACARVIAHADGVAIQTLQHELALGCTGRLRLFADEVVVESTRGDITLRAAQDAVVRGESIHLN